MSGTSSDKPFDPSGKPFKQRLDAFLHFAKIQYGVSIGQDHGRTPEWAQTMHLCHMFLYNAFASSRPKHVDKINKKTIAWEHMSDPKVVWKLIPYSELLRTSEGHPPEKQGAGWKKGMEPDRAKSAAWMQKVLIAGGCARGGKAMIACGTKPCGEPCGCPTGTSKHLDGLAADLKMHDLERLVQKLAKKNAGTLDHLLAAYGLHRPMLHHKTSPEPWHIEAIPPGHPVKHSHPPSYHQLHHVRLESVDLLFPCPFPPLLV